MAERRTHYDILGITPKAPQEIVSAVYRAWMQALRVHPDLGGDEELAKTINAAYETLGDPSRRAAYDAQIEMERARQGGEVRRRAPRARVDVQIAFCIPPSGGWLPAQAIDASSLGLKFQTAEELCAGMHLSIAFTGSVAPATDATVRWIRRLGESGAWRFEAGVEFFAPVPDILKRLGVRSEANSGR